jgi:uncharacterized protein YutE (UPF0331/DUF86 family)
MKYASINIDKIRDLEADIQGSIAELRKFAAMDDEEFGTNNLYFAAAEHHFRRALEGILTIGTHILSRLPAKTKDYQDIIVKLGEHGIVPRDFAERNKKLAGYRNRMVHLYWEVIPKELQDIIREHIDDLDAFCGYYREVVRDPKKFGLEVEN